jgi:formylglycine-generating enzyme required for sulfatase activity
MLLFANLVASVLIIPTWAAPMPDLKAAKEIVNSIRMKLVRIPAGKFKMGSPTGEKERGDDELLHEVEITKPFYMGIYTVTQAQYKKVMGSNPSWFSLDGDGRLEVLGTDTSSFPVETVSWHDAKKFCEKLTTLAKEKDGRRVYRLPTEAEWEYACRSGTNSRYCSGDSEKDLKNVA